MTLLIINNLELNSYRNECTPALWVVPVYYFQRPLGAALAATPSSAHHWITAIIEIT
jgi:hypothetical protein